MSAIGPYSESLNMRHMYHIRDLRDECISKPRYCKNSIADILASTPDFSKSNCIMTLAQLNFAYEDSGADVTLFVASDKALEGAPDEFFANLDRLTARNIIQASTLKKRITSDLLRDSPASYFVTKHPASNIFVSNISDVTYVNNDLKIIKYDIIAANGIIHVLDGILYPTIL